MAGLAPITDTHLQIHATMAGLAPILDNNGNYA